MLLELLQSDPRLNEAGLKGMLEEQLLTDVQRFEHSTPELEASRVIVARCAETLQQSAASGLALTDKPQIDQLK